jgi:glycerophosphoryl diester phosphodiesterase
MPTIQGHRGCRGLLPENTIPGFIKAIELGCNCIELDVTVTGDNQILVSHEPFPNVEFCSHPSIELTKDNEKELNFYQMSHKEIKQFDCGIKPHPRFSKQENIGIYKPLLKEVVHKLNKLSGSIIYNIEIKSKKQTDGLFHPYPQKYVELLLKEINDLGITNRCIVQSFDIRPLHTIHKNYPKIKLGYIIRYNSFETNMCQIDFIPNFYVAHYSLVHDTLVQQVHNAGMQLFVWTVNREKEMDRILNLNVDSIITDYPDILIQKLNNKF